MPEMVVGLPPNWEKIKAAFPVHEKSPVLYAYGDKFYNPTDMPVPFPCYMHELVHLKQQGDNPEAWWDRYIADPDFRIREELTAVYVEWHWWRNTYRNRKVRQQIRNSIVKRLSGPLYNYAMTKKRATEVLKQMTARMMKEKRDG